MPAFKPAYLIHGDDHGRIAERRRRLRALGEQESGTQGIEVFEGEAATPEVVANALNSLTFALGRRFILVDGVERWTDKQLGPVEAALADLPPDTTIAFFAREDGRTKAPPKLHDVVKNAGGDIAAEQSVKPWELPKWVIARARELGLDLPGRPARRASPVERPRARGPDIRAPARPRASPRQRASAVLEVSGKAKTSYP